MSPGTCDCYSQERVTCTFATFGHVLDLAVPTCKQETGEPGERNHTQTQTTTLPSINGIGNMQVLPLLPSPEDGLAALSWM